MIKKTLIIMLSLFLFYTGSSIAQEISLGDINLQLCYETFSGKYYYPKYYSKYVLGTKTDTKQSQEILNMGFNNYSIRINILKPLIKEKLKGGFEIGFPVPTTWTKREENRPLRTSTFDGIAETGDLMSEYTENTTYEYTSIFYPILLKLYYDNLINNPKLNFNLSLGAGLYIINFLTRYTNTISYVKDYYGHPAGEVSIRRSSGDSPAYFKPAMELGAGLNYKIGKGININMSVKLSYMAIFNSVYETSELTAVDWYPSNPKQNVTMKNGYELGGLGYGFGLGASLKF